MNLIVKLGIGVTRGGSVAAGRGKALPDGSKNCASAAALALTKIWDAIAVLAVAWSVPRLVTTALPARSKMLPAAGVVLKAEPISTPLASVLSAIVGLPIKFPTA
ncbi:MAG: hypothetical protein ACKOEM_05590 [Planctomycetia bacterium]